MNQRWEGWPAYALRGAVAALLIAAVVGGVLWFVLSYLTNGSDCGPRPC